MKKKKNYQCKIKSQQIKKKQKHYDSLKEIISKNMKTEKHTKLEKQKKKKNCRTKKCQNVRVPPYKSA